MDKKMENEMDIGVIWGVMGGLHSFPKVGNVEGPWKYEFMSRIM